MVIVVIVWNSCQGVLSGRRVADTSLNWMTFRAIFSIKLLKVGMVIGMALK